MSEPFDYEKFCLGLDQDDDKSIDEMNDELDRLYIQSMLLDRIYRVQ